MSLWDGMGEGRVVSSYPRHLLSIFEIVMVNEVTAALLKALADKQIPGVPWSLRILLLGQTRQLGLEEAVGGLDVKEETVLEHVLRNDEVRERLLMEANGMCCRSSAIIYSD
jgi:hypothetical protein